MRGTTEPAILSVDQSGVIHCGGSWTLHHLPELEKVAASLPPFSDGDVVCDATDVDDMDTSGAVFLHQVVLRRSGHEHRLTLRGLRSEFAELLDLLRSHAKEVQAVRPSRDHGWLETIGRSTWGFIQGTLRGIEFLGESTTVLGRSLAHPRSIRWRSLFKSLELDGFHALPNIGLLSFLMGIVIAYQGAEQLRTVGANSYIVDLVGIGMLREIAPLVTAILIAGRSGSSYTAQIGTMRVTEELDALRMLGLSPMKVLVLPKALALAIALPLLTVFADAVGVFGGMLIAANKLDVEYREFITRFEEVIPLRHFYIGVVKAPVFAAIIALVGCYQGFQIRGGVDDVGRRTTISVVQSIFIVIVFDALFSILMNWWKL